jgi:alkaline phosphatase
MTTTRVRPCRAVLAALAVMAVGAVLSIQPGCRRRPPALKHVILFIGDGMGVGSEVAASRYLYGRDDGLAWHDLPAKAYVATWDVNVYNAHARLDRRPAYARSTCTPQVGYDAREDGAARAPGPAPAAARRFPPGPATDSASAATALATGFKTDAGNIAWLPGDPEDGALTTILEELRDKTGASIGVVTTVPFDHATPAAFVSHNTSRNAYYTGLKGRKGLGIADEIILRTKPDVVIGGGSPLLDNPDFDAGKGYISESLYRALQASRDYLLVERRPGQDGGLALAEGAVEALRENRKLFGLFGGRGGNFEPPRVDASPGHPRIVPGSEENPSLAEATGTALAFLSRDPDGFFLVVEQGDIDWANHDNDFRTMVGCVADLDGAVRAALAFVDKPGDDVDWTNTALIVTADHATGGLVLDPGRPLGLGELPRQDARVEEPADALPRTGSDRGVAANGASLKKPDYVSPYVYPDDEISYASAGHTNELVDLAAIGAADGELLALRGRWYPGLILDNTQVNAALRRALGLRRLGRHARRSG